MAGQFPSRRIANFTFDVAGLQPSTCQKWTFFVRLFLNAQFRPKTPELELDQLRPKVLLDFVLQQAEHYPPGQLQSLASALRSFCRFLCVSGCQPQDLSAALPSISGHHRENLPIYLSGAQLKQLLKVFDRRTLLGKRDYAIIIMDGGCGYTNAPVVLIQAGGGSGLRQRRQSVTVS